MKLSRLYAVIVPKVTIWLYQVFNLSTDWPRKEISHLISRISALIMERGEAWTLSYIKKVRVIYLAYLSGKPIKLDEVRVTNDGIPKILGGLIPYIRRSEPPVSLLRVLNTVLWRSRALSTGKIPDINPIVAPSKRGEVQLGKYRNDFWKDLGYKPSLTYFPRKMEWSEFHMTTKSGPNGHRLWTSLVDFTLLPDTLRDHLSNIRGSKFIEKVSVLDRGLKVFDWLIPENASNKGLIRKLSYFPDKEDKVRIIRIGDYWSQTVLRPWHNYLYRVLRNIPQDCTFNQGSFKDKIDFSKESFSVDLSSATDRFPIELISSVLKGLLPRDKVDSWEQIIVGYPFSYKDENGVSRLVNYSVGNPIGFYSSWASFAVAHHYVIYYCCRELNIDFKSAKYVVLGDDVVINDSSLGMKYIEVLKELGVDYSPHKTLISETVVEFAKRLFYKGSEITPFPISAIQEGSKHYYVLTALIVDLRNRGWVTNCGIPSRVSLWFKNGLHRKAKNCLQVKSSATAIERVLIITRGVLPAGQALSELAQEMGFSFPPFSDIVGENILRDIRVESFRNSNPENDTTSKGVGLGQIAISLVETLSGEFPESDPIVGIELIQCLPILYRYGLIEEIFIDLKKTALKIDRNGLDWTPLLKTIALPLDDTIFVKRSSHLIYKSTAVIGVKLLERFTLLKQFPQLLSF